MRNIIRLLAHTGNITKASTYSAGSRTRSNAFLHIVNAPRIFSVRSMSGERKVDLSYEELLEEKVKSGVVLVDVREHKEIQETGKLPDSIHIPLGELQQALQMKPEEFKGKYDGAEQPSKDTDLIFSCRGGVRSRKAMAAAQEVGFANVRHFAGGWLDWEANTKK